MRFEKRLSVPKRNSKSTHPVGLWLSGLRNGAGLTQADLAERLGISRSILAAYETGARPIQPDVTAKVIEMFPHAPSVPKSEDATSIVDIRLLGRDREDDDDEVEMPYAGLVPTSEEWGDPLETSGRIRVPSRFRKGSRFAARVIGDSCWPALKQGDVTIWEPDLAPRAGLLVLAQRRGDHGCTVKQYKQDSHGGDVLVPVNPRAATPPNGTGWGVVAKLVGVVRQRGKGKFVWSDDDGLTPADLTFEDEG